MAMQQYREKFKPPEQRQYGVSTDSESAKQRAASMQLQEFDFSLVPPDGLIIIDGKRRFGKTIWGRYLLSKMHRWFPDGGYVFTNTKHNYFWQQHFPDTRIYNGIDWEVIDRIKEEQKAKKQRMLDEGEAYEGIPWVCIIFEDVASLSHDLKYTDMIRNLAFEGRHFMIMVMIMIQVKYHV